MPTLIMMVAMIALLAIGLPVAASLGLVGAVALLIAGTTYFGTIGLVIWNAADNYVLLSIPLFVLMGELFQRSGLALRFYSSAKAFFYRLPGGLLQVNIASCAIFAAISGSSIATSATIGRIAYPELLRLGYDRSKIAGSLAAGGTLGILIPPSIPLIIYAAIVEESVSKLFVAAIIPGLLMTFAFMLYNALFSRPPERPADMPVPTARDYLLATRDLVPLMLLIIAVLGSIYGGYATATEAAAVGVAGTLAVAAAYKLLNIGVVVQSLRSTAHVTAVLLSIFIGAQIFSYAVFVWGGEREMQDLLNSLQLSPIVLMGSIILMYVLLGIFLEEMSVLILTVSFTHKLVVDMGYSGIWYGVMLVLLIEIGLISPPVGMNLYTIQMVGAQSGVRVTMGELSRGVTPYMIMLLAGVILLWAFPEIALWLTR